MKYRRLRREELEELEPQFVRFLAAQGIPGEDWVKLKVTDEARTEQLINQFSQLVFDDVLRRCEYLEQRGPRQLLVYHCTPDRLYLRGLLVEGETTLDLRQNRTPVEMAALVQGDGARLKLVAAERSYQPDRPSDLFRLLEQGGRIATSPELFDLLGTLAQNTQPQPEQQTQPVQDLKR